MTSATVLTLWAWLDALTLTTALLALTTRRTDPEDHPTWEEQ